MQTRTLIKLKFGIDKGLIKVNLSTKFSRNLMNIHGVMTNYLCKIRSKVCHAPQGKPLEGMSYVDRVTIIGVFFCGLKGIQIKAIDI